MKGYVITSGAIFALITIAHILRMASEGRHLFAEPVFILLTLLSAALSVWAVLVLRKL